MGGQIALDGASKCLYDLDIGRQKTVSLDGSGVIVILEG